MIGKKSKWIPLGNFSHGSSDHITFVKKNFKTGMLYFKTKQVNGWFGAMQCYSNFVPSGLIDTKKQWEYISNLEQDTPPEQEK